VSAGDLTAIWYTPIGITNGNTMAPIAASRAEYMTSCEMDCDVGLIERPWKNPSVAPTIALATKKRFIMYFIQNK
jgi:hypothetical protein